MAPPRSGAEDYRMLLTVIAGISLGVAATALPVLIEGPFLDWLYGAKLVMWFTGVSAGVLEYLAVSFGSRLYLVRVEVFATASLALVFLAQAGLFLVLLMKPDLLVTRWFAMFAIFCAIAGLEANHGRRMVVRHAGDEFPRPVVHAYARSLAQIVYLLLGAGLAAAVFAIVGADSPAWLVFLAACGAFAVVTAANIQQEGIRTFLADAIQDRPQPAKVQLRSVRRTSRRRVRQPTPAGLRPRSRARRRW